MNIKKQLVVFATLTLLLAISAVGFVQADSYDDILHDDEGDVDHVHTNGIVIGVERQDVDIIRAELSESGGTVTISLTVKGVIRDHTNITYYIYLEDETEDGFYMLTYTEESCQIWASNNNGYSIYEGNAVGSGTDTLTITTTLGELLNPDTLKLDTIFTYDYYTANEYYWDSASPGDEDSEFLPEDFELKVEPTIGQAPLEVYITISADNNGDESGQIPVFIDDKTVDILELDAQDWNELEFEYIFQDAGTYSVEFGDQTVTVYVQGENNDEPDEPYSHKITDPEDDVMQVGEDESDWKFVKNSKLDITSVEISESGGMVTVSLKVKGTIEDQSDLYYEIFMKDNRDGLYEIHYTYGDVEMSVYSDTFGAFFEPSVSGVGTNTLRFTFTRDQIGSPDDLELSWAVVFNEDIGQGDLAGPDADYPPNYVDPGDDDKGSTTDPSDDDTDGDKKTAVDKGLPGFTIIFLAISILAAVLIYRRR